MKLFFVDRYFFPQTHHPALKGVGYSHQRKPRRFVGPHRHPAPEICLLAGGQMDYETEGHFYTIPVDHLHITWAGEIHGSPHRMIPPCQLHWISYDLEHFTPRDLHPFQATGRRLYPGGQILIPLIESIRAECRRPRRDTREAIEAYLQILTIQVIRILESEGATGVAPQEPLPLRQALALIEKEDLAELRIATIAEATGISRTHLHQLFVRHLGISPKSYLQERRLKKAAEAVSSSDTAMTDIAFALGFASSQHFASAFKKRFGLTPTRFREERQATL